MYELPQPRAHDGGLHVERAGSCVSRAAGASRAEVNPIPVHGLMSLRLPHVQIQTCQPEGSDIVEPFSAASAGHPGKTRSR